MEQGALGVASSLSGPPGAWIDTATLVGLCEIAGQYGGIYSTHMRTEGFGVFESVAEAIEIGRNARVPVDIIHLKIARAQVVGTDAGADPVHCQCAAERPGSGGARLPPAGQNNLSSIIPPWAHKGAGRRCWRGCATRRSSSAWCARLRTDTGVELYNHYTATGSWEGMLLVSLSNPAYKKFEGRRMNDVIRDLGGVQ